MDATLTTDKYVDVNTVYRFDPTKEHMVCERSGDGEFYVNVRDGDKKNNNTKTTLTTTTAKTTHIAITMTTTGRWR